LRVVYADTVFVINLIMNFFTLLAAARICDAPAKRWRLALSAGAGGVYAVLAELPPLGFLATAPVKLAFGVLLALIAFWGVARLLRVTLVFFAVSAAAAGAVLGAALIGGDGIFTYASLKVLLLSFAVCYAAVSVIFRGTARQKGATAEVSITHGGRGARMRALIDNGSTLRDPVTGDGVIVAGIDDIAALFPGDTRDKLSAAVKKGAVAALEEARELTRTRFRLIPYSAVGVSGGMLLAFKPEEITVNGQTRRDLIVALSPNCVSDNGTYTALMGVQPRA
jgi:stage II sporulation protein GA (sporulation sigma-E factor processing peptidase)